MITPLAVIKAVDAGATTVELTDLALSNGRVYSYKIWAVDRGGHFSALSSAVKESPQAGPEWSQ